MIESGFYRVNNHAVSVRRDLINNPHVLKCDAGNGIVFEITDKEINAVFTNCGFTESQAFAFCLEREIHKIESKEMIKWENEYKLNNIPMVKKSEAEAIINKFSRRVVELEAELCRVKRNEP